MNLIFLGPPGSGKGTQAKKLAEKLNLPHVALGDILREIITEGSEIGMQAKSFVEAGKLVPDEMTIEITRQRMAKADCQSGFILDGFPRSMAQAEALSGILKGKVYKVIYFTAPIESIVMRNTGRLSCKACGSVYHETFNPPKVAMICDKCGEALYKRGDDNEEVIRTRFKVYQESTAPVVGYYKAKGNLVEIDANGSITDMFQRLLTTLGV